MFLAVASVFTNLPSFGLFLLIWYELMKTEKDMSTQKHRKIGSSEQSKLLLQRRSEQKFYTALLNRDQLTDMIPNSSDGEAELFSSSWSFKRTK